MHRTSAGIPMSSGAVADGHELPLSWDINTSKQVAWRIAIPGLAHSSPIVGDGRIYLTSAAAADGEVGLVTGDVDAAGIDPAADLAPHEWHLFAIDLADGEIIWDTVAHRGVPRLARHAKASHANASHAKASHAKASHAKASHAKANHAKAWQATPRQEKALNKQPSRT